MQHGAFAAARKRKPVSDASQNPRGLQQGSYTSVLGIEFMPWILLLVAGMLEAVWAYSMKMSEGFTLVVPSLVTLVAMIASVTLLSISMKSLPLGTAYTVWTGIGAGASLTIGITVLGESATPMRLTAAGLILVGILTMRLADT